MSMEAAVLPAFGDATSPEVRTVDAPEAGPGSVVVDVSYCSLNNRDRVICRGEYDGVTLPYVLGSDVAGRVAEVGEDVTGVAVGDRVVRYPVESCGECEHCLVGEQSRCPEYGIVDGGCAERVAVDPDALVPVPEDLSLQTAATLPVAPLTAWRMLRTRGDLRAGETVLVVGGSGGVGTAAVRLADEMGATVVAVTSSDEFRERLADLGATHTVDRTAEDFAERTRELTGGRGADVVVDPVGEATIPRSMTAAANGGRVVACGRNGGQFPEIDVRELFARHLDLRGSTMGSFTEFRDLVSFVAARGVEFPVHEVVPLAETAEGLAALRDGEAFGSVLVSP